MSNNSQNYENKSTNASNCKDVNNSSRNSQSKDQSKNISQNSSKNSSQNGYNQKENY